MNRHTLPSTLARLVLGGTVLVFGLNIFLNFIPQPPHDPRALPFLGGLAAAGYMFPLLGLVEVAVGLALVTNRFVPLALVVLAPLMVHILLFHAFLSPPGIGMVGVLLAAQLWLVRAHWGAFAPLLRARSAAAPAAEGTTLLRERAA